MKKITKALLAAGASLALVGGIAAPALAQDGPYPVTATATGIEVIKLTLSTNTVAFGNFGPGDVKDVPGAETATITTNMTKGADLVMKIATSNQGWMKDAGGASTLNLSDVSIKGTSGSYVPISNGIFTGDSQTFEHTDPGVAAITQAWKLTVPVNYMYVGGVHLGLTYTAIPTP